MTWRYLPHTSADLSSMLERIGLSETDDLFGNVPSAYRRREPLDLPPALDESALMRHLEESAERNTAARCLSFLGAGMVAHHIPPIVDQLLLRSEFYTAYTPYQAEVSQGTLQAMYEFQTLTCQLFGMDLANASMYDGASAAAEAVLMARRLRPQGRVLLSSTLHPDYIHSVRTYLRESETIDIAVIPHDDKGQSDLNALKQLLSEPTCAVVVGYPNIFGCIENLSALRELSAAHQALLITSTWEPYALSLLRTPGSHDVDIAVGEGQAFAAPPQFGGPGVGLFTCKSDYMRAMPGRLVGKTNDTEGSPGYVLTLSTREQHIRRDRATSNICTNHGLVALAFAIRAALLGKQGLRHIGTLCFDKCEYLKTQLRAHPEACSLPYDATPSFNEFTLRLHREDAEACCRRLQQAQILAGVPLSRWYPERPHDLLIAVTEEHCRDDLDRLAQALVS